MEDVGSNRRWRKVAYGGMQPGFDDNHTDDSFLEEMVTNPNVVKRSMWRAVQESVSISQHLCVVALVALVWARTLSSELGGGGSLFLLLLDAALLGLGFAVLLLTGEVPSLGDLLSVASFAAGLLMLAPLYHTLTRSISSDSVWAVVSLLLVLHLYLHDYSGSAVRNPRLAVCVSLNASVVASVFVASRLPSWLHVFAVLLFSLQAFLFAPLVSSCIKKRSRRLYLCVSLLLMATTLALVYSLHRLLSFALFGVFVFVNLVCPYWLIRIQEYKFEINGPWDEAKLCFDITD